MNEVGMCPSCKDIGRIVGVTRRCGKCGVIWGEIPAILGIIDQMQESLVDTGYPDEESDGYFNALEDLKWEIKKRFLDNENPQLDDYVYSGEGEES